MPNAEFFQKLGLFAVPRFLDEATCARVHAAMTEGRRTDATVGSDTSEFVVDRSYRRTKFVDVPDDVREVVRARLMDARPEIAAHYGAEIQDCQKPQFLAYAPGDFYKPHRDDDSSPTGALLSKERKVSAVIFVNPHADVPRDGCYGGGALTLYELFDGTGGQKIGLPVDPEPGLLITFVSSLLHSVTPVTHGERCTVVSWYR